MALVAIFFAKFMSFILPIICGVTAYAVRTRSTAAIVITAIVASAAAAVAQDAFVCSTHLTCRGLNIVSLLISFLAALAWFVIFWLLFRRRRTT